MSGLYNVLFGRNPQSGVILATLGLTEGQVGRFRDCYVANGEIAVYTRNGGGNRDCWHEGDPAWGEADCGGDSYEVEIDETVYVTEAEAKEKGYELRNVFMGDKRLARTGRRIMETRHRCAQPDSARCACPGCIVQYRLPLHANYLRDADDDFDCTYATIYFRFPEEFAEGLRALDTGEAWNPDAQWRAMLDALSEPAAGRDDKEAFFSPAPPTPRTGGMR